MSPPRREICCEIPFAFARDSQFDAATAAIPVYSHQGSLRAYTFKDMSTDAGCPPKRVRVFLSYAHDDFELAAEIAEILINQNVVPDWDRNVEPGTAFTEAIRGRILHSHVFMPLLTKTSHQRPWIHQETGYAMALNIPVLPLVIGEVNQLTPTMIAQLQAIVVPQEEKLAEKLRDPPIGVIVRQLVQPLPFTPRSLVEIAYWPESRTELLAKYAARVLELAKQAGGSPTVRQRGALSSFCIPDADETHRIWRDREKPKSRSDYYHYLQRLERQALERCTLEGGCKLIVDPVIDRRESKGVSLEAQVVRLRTLLEFLTAQRDNPLVEVVISRGRIGGNLTILGDWFFADSLVPRAGKGYYQTVFNWHAPSAFQKVIEFDREFNEACSVSEHVGAQTVTARIADFIREIEGETVDPPPTEPPFTAKA
jgi:hypothetical protein